MTYSVVKCLVIVIYKMEIVDSVSYRNRFVYYIIIVEWFLSIVGATAQGYKCASVKEAGCGFDSHSGNEKMGAALSYPTIFKKIQFHQIPNNIICNIQKE